jgi:hypothetical protein
MRLFGVRRNAPQVPATYPSDAKDLSRAGSWTACALATIAALALIFSAGAQNVAHGWNIGLASSEYRAWVLAAASAGASVLGPFCWLAVFRGRGFGPRMAALVLALGCLAYAAVCSLGFVAGSRDTAHAALTERADAYQDKRAVAAAARAELAALATKPATKAVLDRKRELTALLTKNADIGINGPAAAKQDSQAAALAFYARAAGYQISDEAVGTWLSLGTVLFLELAAALSLSAAAALRPIRQPRQIGPVAAEALPPSRASESPRQPPAPRKHGPRTTRTTMRHRHLRRGAAGAGRPPCCRRRPWTSCARLGARQAAAYGAWASCWAPAARRLRTVCCIGWQRPDR